MKRHAAFAVPLGPRYFRTSKSSGTVNFNTLCAKAKGRRNCLFHGSAEGDAAFQLECDIFRHQLSFQLRAPDLLNIDIHLLASHGLKVFLELVNLGTLFPDNNTWDVPCGY